MMTAALPRRLLAEFAGTALLVTAVVGSGVMAQQLSPDDVALQLLENSDQRAGTPVQPTAAASSRTAPAQ